MKKNSGLTLVEVLIALAIVAIAMTAVIKATAQNSRSTHYLQNKMIATWVGAEVINELRVNVRALAVSSEAMKNSSEMLGRTWFWDALKEATPNSDIDKIRVTVFENQNRDAVLMNLETYVYHEKK